MLYFQSPRDESYRKEQKALASTEVVEGFEVHFECQLYLQSQNKI